MKQLSLFALILCAITACGHGQTDEERGLWGSADTFNSYLWKKYKPVTLTKTLEVNFNQDAKETLTGDLVLGLAKKTSNGSIIEVPVTEAVLSVNGTETEDNTFRISKDGGDFEIGVKLLDVVASRSDMLPYRLVVKENPGLDQIDDIMLDGSGNTIPDDIEVGGEMNIDVRHHINSLKVGTNTTLTIILIGFILLIIFSRLSHPSFGVRRLYLTNDITQRTINLKGAGRVILTGDKKKNQSFFMALFVRRTVFVVDEFFNAGDILVEPKFRISTDSGKRNGIRLSGRSYDIPNKTLAKDQEESVSQIDTNNKINIKIQ